MRRRQFFKDQPTHIVNEPWHSYKLRKNWIWGLLVLVGLLFSSMGYVAWSSARLYGVNTSGTVALTLVGLGLLALGIYIFIKGKHYRYYS